MPTNTFYNLPKEKQDKVLEAAKEEFFRAKDGNVLVKNIVISAGIPRGSFYQYFESKEDLIDFISNNERKSIPLSYFEDNCYRIDIKYAPRLDYIKYVDKLILENANSN